MKTSTQNEVGLTSDLSAELDSLLEMADDYLSAQKERRFTPCNPDFLIKHLAINAKRLQEYEKRLLWLADFMANNSNKTIIDFFGECCSTMHVIQNIDEAMTNRESN